MADSSQEPKKKRGRPKKVQPTPKPAPAKKRGRPRKNTIANTTAPAAKRKRGRPPKLLNAAAANHTATVGPPRRKRGRPPKIAQDFAAHREDKRRSTASLLLNNASFSGKSPDGVPPEHQQLHELKSGLDYELDVFLQFLPSVLDKLRIRFERRIEALREALHKHAKETSGDDCEHAADELTAVIQKAAGRLASFRAEGNHGAGDIARLAKKLDRVLKRLDNAK
ncbi:MAG TPA: hypothetical protein PKH51_02455 [Candidatus Sumerlaeota bacterium]|nr:hypothetical protein [Candidatus Sumerlaeota bacterium]HNM45854.1 hypothetical protein [Candidatus Sumerlaeota bacterium]